MQTSTLRWSKTFRIVLFFNTTSHSASQEKQFSLKFIWELYEYYMMNLFVKNQHIWENIWLKLDQILVSLSKNGHFCWQRQRSSLSLSHTHIHTHTLTHTHSLSHSARGVKCSTPSFWNILWMNPSSCIIKGSKSGLWKKI